MSSLEIKIIKRLLNEFRMPEKELNLDLNTKLSPAVVSKALDDAIGNKHVNGKPYPAWLKSVKEDSIKKIKLTVASFKKFIKTEIADVSNHEDVLSIWRSFYLFTSASVAAIRDPSKYDAKKAINFTKDSAAVAVLPYELKDDDRFLHLVDFTPTKQDYENASAILKYAASSKIKVYDEIHRGITVPKQVRASLAPGIQFQNWPISSWTLDRKIAMIFSKTDYDYETENRIILTVKGCEYGCAVGDATNYQNEEEIVMGKKLEIVEVIAPRASVGNVYLVECKVIN
jgi:hypothetical protein